MRIDRTTQWMRRSQRGRAKGKPLPRTKLCLSLLGLLAIVLVVQVARPDEPPPPSRTEAPSWLASGDPVGEPSPSLFGQAGASPPRVSLQRTIFALVLVLVLILVAIPVAKKVISPRLRSGRQGRLRVAETLPLGGRRFLCLVEVPGKTLLLGVTEDAIESLTEIEGVAEGTPDENGGTGTSDDEARPGRSMFSRILDARARDAEGEERR